MKGAKYLIGFFVGTFVYVCLSLLVGPNSFKCYEFLEEQKMIVSKQASELENISKELKLEKNALKNDKAVIAAYARKLGYAKDDEKIIKINGLKPYQAEIYNTGSVVRHEEPVFISEKFCKIVSICLGLFIIIITFIYDLIKGNFSFKKEEKTYIAGVPVYDLPQI